jgi:predicted Zn-dependent protease
MEPQKPASRNEAFNFLMGLLYSGKEQYARALSAFKKSDTSNSCVKYCMAIAYNQLGRIDEAEQLFTELAGCQKADGPKTAVVKLSDNWVKTVAAIREKAE